MDFFDNTKFKPCCDHKRHQFYKILHNPKPLPLTKELHEAIEMCLWYSPNISSKQSIHQSLLNNEIYDDIIFSSLMRSLTLNEEDILITSSISSTVKEFFENQICLNCQKIIFTKKQKETKAVAFLRHLRNAIAHGNFTIAEDQIIAFDENKSNITTAIIKIKPMGVLRFINDLNSLYLKEDILAFAFKQIGYEAIIPAEPNYGQILIPDLILKRDHITYFLEIKKISTRYIHPHDLISTNAQNKNLNIAGNQYYFIFDSSKLTKETRAYIVITNINVIDREKIKELFQGVDILDCKN